ncbi:MAG: hypothetical protein WAR81_10575 [Pseudomonadales bacterium]
MGASDISLPTVTEYRRYWRFFWPLALSATFMLIGQQAFNGVLARHADPERELAVYAYAIGVFFFFDVGTAFMPNMVTVFARSQAARQRVRRFCFSIGAAFAVPVALLGLTATGNSMVGILFRIEGAMLRDVCAYLGLLSGLILLHVTHHYYNGLLILAERTSWVSIIGVLSVAIGVSTAIHGFRHQWHPVYILGGAEWLSGLFKLAALLAIWRGVRGKIFLAEEKVPGYRDLLQFFWPVCISGMTFGVSRPLIFVFVSRVPDAVAIIAAMRVSMDFLMLYQAVVNQFRHFFSVFGFGQLAQKRRFMALVAGSLTLAMTVVLVVPPFSEAFFLGALGLNPQLYASARYMCFLLLVVPTILMVRNYYHGILIARKRTAAMATGSFVRVVAIAGSGALLLGGGVLDERTAVLGMIAGFLAEMIIAWRSVLRLERDHPGTAG